MDTSMTFDPSDLVLIEDDVAPTQGSPAEPSVVTEAPPADFNPADLVLMSDEEANDSQLISEPPQGMHEDKAQPVNDDGDGYRGFATSMYQIPQLGYGVAGLIGATAEKVTGYGKGLKDWGFSGYQDAAKKAAPLSRENDDVTKAWDKAWEKGDIGALVDWVQYGSGYALGQVLETVAVAGIGAAAGAAAGAETGPGALLTGAAGGVAGAVGKGAFKTAVKGMVEKVVSREAVKIAARELEEKGVDIAVKEGAEQVVKHAETEAVRQAATKAAALTINKKIGSTAAVSANSLGMELGSIYPEAELQAQAEGRQLSGTDLARIWGSGIAAGGMEAVTDMLGLEILTGNMSKVVAGAIPSSITGKVAQKVAAGAIGGAGAAVGEGVTEFVQTGLERFGAGKDVTGEEAANEYINAAAMGALGGAQMAAPASAIAHKSVDPQVNPQRIRNEALALGMTEIPDAMLETNLSPESIAPAAEVDSEFVEHPLDAPLPVTVGGQTFEVAGAPGPGLAAKMFGETDAESQYQDDLDPKSFDLKPIKGSANKVVTYEGDPVNRSFNPISGEFSELTPIEYANVTRGETRPIDPALKFVQRKADIEAAATEEKAAPASAKASMGASGSSAATITTVPVTTPLSAPTAQSTTIPTTQSHVSQKDTEGQASTKIEQGQQIPQVQQQGRENVLSPERAAEVEASAVSRPAVADVTRELSHRAVHTDGVTRFNSESGQIEIGAEDSDADINTRKASSAAIDQAAFHAEGDVEALVDSIDEIEPAYRAIQKNHPNASPEQMARLVVSAAVNGDPKARALVSGISDPKAKEQINSAIQAIQKHGLQGEVGKQVDKAIARVREVPLASPVSTTPTIKAPGAPVAQTPSGSVSVPKATFDALVKPTRSGEKGSYTIDSGTTGATITKPLPIGSVISTTDANGKVTGQHRVIFTTSIEGSKEVRHHIAPVALNENSTGATAIPAVVESYTPNSEILTSSKSLVDGVVAALGSVNLSASRGALIKQLEKVVGNQIAIQSSRQFVKDSVVFESDVIGFMTVEDKGDGSKVHVNSEALLDYIIGHIQLIPLDNQVALDAAARDTSELIAQMGMEEQIHFIAEQVVPQEEMVPEMRKLIELTSGNEALRNEFLSSARWQTRAHNGNVLFSDQALLDLFSGNSTLTGDELDAHLNAVGHELLASLIARIKTGKNTEQMHQQYSNWALKMAESAGKDASKLQTLIARLTEMANRLIYAISNFFDAQRAHAQLPTELKAFADNIIKLMDEGGFKAPDVLSIQKQAIQSALDGMGHMNASAKRALEVSKAQAQLNEQVSIMRGLRLDPNWQPIGLDPLTGHLVGNDMTSAELARVQPFLDEINASGRMDVAMRSAAMQRDLTLLLRRLNGGREITQSSKILDGNIWQVLADGNARLIGHALRPIKTAFGFSPDASEEAILVKANQALESTQIRNARVRTAREQGPSALMESLSHLIDNPEFVAPKLKNLASDVREAQSVMRSIQAGILPAPDYADIQAATNLENAISALNAHLEQMAKGKSNTAEQIRQIRKNLAVDLALQQREFAKEREAMRPVSSLRDLVDRWKTNPEAITQALKDYAQTDESMSSEGMARELSEASEILEALRRSNEFPEQLEYMAMGGSQPKSMWTRQISWKPLNAEGLDYGISVGSVSLTSRLAPVSIAVSPTSKGPTEEQLQAGVLDPQKDAQGSFSIKGTEGSVSFSFDPTQSQQLDSAALVEDSDGKLRIPARAYPGILTNLGFEVRASAGNASRMLGVEPGTGPTGVNMLSDSFNQVLKSNARHIVSNLTLSMGDAMWRGKAGITTEVALSGGFPLPLIEVPAFQEGNPSEYRVQVMDSIIDLPDHRPLVQNQTTPEEQANMLLDDGILGELLLNVSQFVSAMNSPTSSATRPVHVNGESLTPAGFVHQLVGPKMVEILALTKGTLSQRIINGNPRLQELYDTLAPGLEESPAFINDRKKMAEWTPSINAKFWDLWRMSNVANSAYKAAIKKASEIHLMKNDVEGYLQGLPIDDATLKHLAYETSFRGRMARASEVSPGTLVALLSPTSAINGLNQLNALRNEPEMMVFKDSGIDEQGNEVKIFTGQQEGLNSVSRQEAHELQDRQVDTALSKQEAHRRRFAAWRSTWLMVLLGGDSRAVMQFVHSPEFYRSYVEDGEMVSEYHTDRIDSFIEQELDRLHKEEKARGVVRGPGQGGTRGEFDTALNALTTTSPEQEKALKLVLENGGIVGQDVEPKVAGELQEFEADTQSAMQMVSGLIPNVSVVTGFAPWENSQDEDAPTVVFIPDATSPTLVMPYGARVQMRESDTRDAIAAMFEWLGTHGNVGVQAQAMRITDVLSNTHLLASKIKGSIRNHLSMRLKESGVDLTEDLDAYVEANTEIWTEMAKAGVSEVLANVQDASSDYLLPETAAHLLQTEKFLDLRNSSRILALALTQPAVKKALVLSSVQNDLLPTPTDREMKVRGDLVGMSSLPGVVDQLAMDFADSIPENYQVTNEQGMVVKPSSDKFLEDAKANAWALFEKSLAEKGITLPQLSEMETTLLADQQAASASSLLHDILNQLQSTSEDTQPLVAKPRPIGLSEMEARQALAFFGDSHLQEAISINSGEEAIGRPMAMGELTPTDLMQLNADAAERLRAEYHTLVPFENSTTENQAYNYRTLQFDSRIDGGSVDVNVWYNNRVHKGEMRYMELLGAEFGPYEGGRRDGKIVADSHALEKKAAELGLLQFVEVDARNAQGQRIAIVRGKEIPVDDGTTEVNGIPLTMFKRETINTFEEGRRIQAQEKAASDKVLRDINSAIAVRESKAQAAQEMLEQVKAISEDLVGIEDASAMLDRLRENENINVGQGGTLDAEPIIRQFFDGPAQLASDMARQAVNSFRDGMRQFMRSFSIERMVVARDQNESSIWGKDPLAGFSAKQLAAKARERQRELSAPRSTFEQEMLEIHDERAYEAQLRADEVTTNITTLRALESQYAPKHASPPSNFTPTWYASQPDKVQNKLMGARRVALKSVDKFNSLVAKVAEKTNGLVDNLIDVESFLIERSLENADTRTASFVQQVEGLGNRERLVSMAETANIINALNSISEGQSFRHLANPMSRSASSGKMEPTARFSGGQRVDVPTAAIEELQRAFRSLPEAQQQAEAERILMKHVFPGDVIAQRALAALEQHIANEGAVSVVHNDDQVMEMFKSANAPGLFTGLSTAQRNRIIASVANSIMANQLNSDEMAVQHILKQKTDAELSYLSRRNSVHAARPAGSDFLKYSGTPEEIAISRHAARKYGHLWSMAQQAQVGSSGILDGMTDSIEAARTTDQRAELGAAALSLATGINYTVTGGMVVPESTLTRILEESTPTGEQKNLNPKDFQEAAIAATLQQKRIALASPILAPVPAAKRLDAGFVAKIDKMMKGLHKANTFGDGKSKAPGILDRFDPMKSVKDHAELMLIRLQAAKDSGALKSVNAETLPDGTLVNSLHDRIDTFLNGVASHPNFDSIAQISSLFRETVGHMMADESLISLVDGFIPGELFSRRILKGLLNHDATIRVLFAKAAQGHEAAANGIGILEFGTTGVLGREGFTAQQDAFAKSFRAAQKLVTGPNRFEKMTEGYMYQAVEGYLKANPKSMDDRAKALLRMFDQADEGVRGALAQGMPPYMGGSTVAEVLAMPKNALAKVRQYLHEDTFKLLEERAVYAAMRDKWKPTLQAIALDGSSGNVATLMGEQYAAMDKESRVWGKFLNEHMTHVSQSLLAQMRLQGIDTTMYEGKPAVPFHWQTFNREFNLDAPTPTISEQLELNRTGWAQNPTRVPKKGEIHMLQVNGAEAPVHIINDMLYRLNVQPAYEEFAEVFGVAQHVEKTLESTKDGSIAKLAEERLGTNKSMGISAARSVALLGQEVVHKDMTKLSPKNRTMALVHKFQQLGAVQALISAKQIWSQVIPALVVYSTIRNGAGKNMDFLPLYTKYLFGKTIGRVPYLRDITGAGAQKSISDKIDEYVLRNAPNIYKRTADGNQIYLQETARIQPSKANRALGRVTGKWRSKMDAVMRPLGAAEQGVSALADKMLHAVLATPESTLTRGIFVHSILNQLNERRIADSMDPITMEELVRPKVDYGVTPDMYQKAARDVTDMMAPSDGSKKAKVFQQTDSAFTEVLRGMLVTFANHQMATSGNSYAGWQMIRNGDAEAKKEGKRLIASNLSQNIIFQVFRYETMAMVLGASLAAAFDWDEDEEQDFVGSLYGIDPEEGEEGRNAKAMRWISLIAGGSANPIGYNQKDEEWTDAEAAKDKKQMGLMVSKELVNAVPFGGVGLAASTALGSSLNEWALKNTLMQLFPGQLGVYERAGLVIPERWGGSGEGPQSENGLERSAYAASRIFINDVSNRSAMTSGLSSVMEPIVQMSNAPEEVELSDAALIWLAQFPAMPRELSGMAQKRFGKNTDAQIWDNSWRAR